MSEIKGCKHYCGFCGDCLECYGEFECVHGGNHSALLKEAIEIENLNKLVERLGADTINSLLEDQVEI